MAQQRPQKRRVSSWFFAGAVCLWVAVGCSGPSGGGSPIPPGPAQGLLRGKAPSASSGVNHPERMTDGVGAEPGNFWHTEVTSVVDPGGFVTYDRGQSTAIQCAFVEAVHNGNYRLPIS